MVMCTRQHDGYSLFDSKVSDFTSTKTAAGRDFVAEYAEALRRAGLGVGFYYSLLDWRDPAYWAGPKKDPKGWERFLEYVHGQVKELCTQYGKIDVLWYDGYWPFEPRRENRRNSTPLFGPGSPGSLINNRSCLPEDFETPEQQIPYASTGRLWEACVTTMRANWGYSHVNTQWKTTTELIMELMRCASFDCNYLLNVGPHPDGSFPPESVTQLRELGRWLRANGEAVYGTVDASALRQYHHGLYISNVGPVHSFPTVRGHTLYIYVFQWPGTEMVVANLESRVEHARFVDGGDPIRFRQNGSRVLLSALPQYAPDPYATVIALECDGIPTSVNRWPHLIDYGPAPAG